MTAITPNSGADDGSVSITNVAGTSFLAGAALKLTKSGQTEIVATDVTILSPTQITCDLDLTPTVTGITPGNGVSNGSVSITNLAGTGFAAGATVKLRQTGQPDIVATGVTRPSATRLTCVLDLTGVATGAWDVVVTNADGGTGTLVSGFAVFANPAPTVTSITPSNAGANNVGVNITNLAGTGFLPGAMVKLQKTGQPAIDAGDVVVVSENQITCTFDHQCRDWRLGRGGDEYGRAVRH